MNRTFVRLFLVLAPLACSAQAQVSDAGFCRNGLFPREQEHLSLGVIEGQRNEKVHFLDDLDGCPAKGASCKRASYLVAGDEVLIGKTTADWACVWYQGRQREFVDWIPKKNVAVRPAPLLHPVRDWVGKWSDGLSTIRVVRPQAGDKLHISSNLRWDGGDYSGGGRRVHYGGMKAALDVQGSKATGSERDCQIVLTRIGKYLVADDNGACGGMNVRHTGVYFRRPG